MGCCVSSGPKDVKVEPWPSYHETFKGRNSNINSTLVTPKEASGERKQLPRNPELRPASEATKNQAKTTNPVPRSKSTQTNFNETTKRQAGKQDGTKKLGTSRLIQVTEADFTADFISTEDRTRSDKAKENSKRPLSPLNPGQTRTSPDDRVELESINEEAVKGTSAKDVNGDLAIDDLEEDQLPSKDIEEGAVESAKERVGDVNHQNGQTEKDDLPVESKNEESCESQELEEGKGERIQSQSKMKSDVIEDKELDLMIADIMSDTADVVSKHDGHVPLNSASEQIKALEPVEGLNDRYSEHLTSLPKSVDNNTTEFKEKETDIEKTAEVHETCSVCQAIAPPPMSTEGNKAMDETTDASLDTTVQTTEKDTKDTEDLHEECSVCMTTAPSHTETTDANDPEKETKQTEHAETPSSDTEAENINQKIEIHEACSVCLTTAPPTTETSNVNEKKIEETQLVEGNTSDTIEGNLTQKESNEQEEVHEVCSVCLATVLTTSVNEEENAESTDKTKDAEAQSSLTPADTEQTEGNEKEAEVHETCSVCMATASMSKDDEGEGIERTDTTVDSKSSSTNTHREETAAKLAETEENLENSAENLATENLVDSIGRDADTGKVNQEEMGKDVHEACSVCLATTPHATVPTVEIENTSEDNSKNDTEENLVREDVHQTCSVCLASSSSEKEEGGVNAAGRICSAADMALSVSEGDVAEEKLMPVDPSGTELPPEFTLDNDAENNSKGVDVHETCSVCLATGSPNASATEGTNKVTNTKVIESSPDTNDTTEYVAGNINSHEPLPQEITKGNPAHSDGTEIPATAIGEREKPEAKLSSHVATIENPAESTKETTGEVTESSTITGGEHSIEATEPPPPREVLTLTVAPEGTAMATEPSITKTEEDAAGGEESSATTPKGSPEDTQVSRSQSAPHEDTSVPAECSSITTATTESEIQAETLIEDNAKEEVHQTCSVCLATDPDKAGKEQAQNVQQAAEIRDAEEVHEACSVCLAAEPITPATREESSEEKVKEVKGEQIHETCSVCLAAESPTTKEVATMDKASEERIVEVHEMCSVCMATATAPSVPAESGPAEQLSESREVIPTASVVEEDQTQETVIDVHDAEDIHETCSVCIATGTSPSERRKNSNTKVNEVQQARGDVPGPPDISTKGKVADAPEKQEDHSPVLSSTKVASSTNHVENDDFAGDENHPNTPASTRPTPDGIKETGDQDTEVASMETDKKSDKVENGAIDSGISNTPTDQGIQDVDLPETSEDIPVADIEEKL